MNNAIQTNNNGSNHKTLKFLKLFTHYRILDDISSKQEAQLMLTTGATRLAVSRGQQT